MKKVFITGGAGYVGSSLVKELVEQHDVTVLDALWFGNSLTPHKNLKVVRGDTRNIEAIDLSGFDVVIHLANIANDPSVELNETLSWEVNVLATQQIIEKAIHGQVKTFIYASSGSVYGVSDKENVTEDTPLKPISAYNKTKMVAERVVMSYANDIKTYCIRPATVCGWSPRMRLDVSVNLLTYQALSRGEITVFGGKQTRPNIHIKDMVGVYKYLLSDNPPAPGIYNAGFENMSIMDIAVMISGKVPCKISTKESTDPRSYRVDSSKLLNVGFLPRFNVEAAIDDLIHRYRAGELADSPNFHTVKTMVNLGLGKKN